MNVLSPRTHSTAADRTDGRTPRDARVVAACRCATLMRSHRAIAVWGSTDLTRWCHDERAVLPELLGTALGSGPAREPREGGESAAECSPARGDRGHAAGLRPRCGMRARIRGDLARRLRVASHRGRLLR